MVFPPLSDVVAWSADDSVAALTATDQPSQSTPPRFPFSASINSQVSLSKSTCMFLDGAHSMCVPSNEKMTSTVGVAGSVREAGGAALAQVLADVEGVRTGHSRRISLEPYWAILRSTEGGSGAAPDDWRLAPAAAHAASVRAGSAGTPGFPSSFRSLMYTCGPRYSTKYKTAADNALHMCYRSALQLAAEAGDRVVVVPVLHAQRKGYPPEAGAHIALRTVRRLLERLNTAFDRVALVCEDGAVDYSVYRRLMPLYFPRSADEARIAESLLPSDTGNEYGETIIEERKIRIGLVERMGEGEEEHSDGPGDEGSLVSQAALLAKQRANPDEERQRRLARLGPEELERREREAAFARLASRAARGDFSDIASLRYAYVGGGDQLGRPVLVLVGAALRPAAVDLERVFLYIVRLLTPLASADFTVLYVHTKVESENDPPTAWLRRLYALLDRFEERIVSLRILHPTFWLKAGFTLLSPFMSAQLYEKLTYVDSLRELLEVYRREQLSLPDFVFREDEKKNGIAWLSKSNASTYDVDGL